MTNYVMLNNVHHINLRVVERYLAVCGDNKAAVMTFPTEFADIQREYPILLSKDTDTNLYQAVALLGMQKDENLFLREGELDSSEWLGSYVPAIVARGPFIISLPDLDSSDSAPLIYIDIDHPKVSESVGHPLFLPMGGSSPYLERIARTLGAIQQGKEVGESMFRMLDQMGLIEPITINIELKNGDKFRIEKYHSISEERLENLGGEELECLNRSGYLQGVYLMIASLSQIQRLINIKNARL